MLGNVCPLQRLLLNTVAFSQKQTGATGTLAFQMDLGGAAPPAGGGWDPRVFQKRAADAWRCAGCYVYNDPGIPKCPCCELKNPGYKGPVAAAAPAPAPSAFTFGTAATAAAAAGGGAAAPAPVFKFGGSVAAPALSFGGGAAGTAAAAAAGGAAFKFGGGGAAGGGGSGVAPSPFRFGGGGGGGGGGGTATGGFGGGAAAAFGVGGGSGGSIPPVPPAGARGGGPRSHAAGGGGGSSDEDEDDEGLNSSDAAPGAHEFFMSSTAPDPPAPAPPLAAYDVARPVAANSPVGAVYSYGNDECEQLGHEVNASLPLPRLVNALSGVPVSRVVAGGLHTAALTRDGRVFTWGCNDDRVLGRAVGGGEGGGGAGGPPEGSPGEVTALTSRGDPVVAVSCGDCHMAALTASGVLLAWGTYKSSQGEYGFDTGTTTQVRGRGVVVVVCVCVFVFVCGLCR